MDAAERDRIRLLVDQRRRHLTGRAPDGIKHGTAYAYKQGCHCRDCRGAAASTRRRYRQKAA